MEDLTLLEQLAKPLAEYLRKNHHPHTAIVVTDERVVVVETALSVPLKENECGRHQQKEVSHATKDEAAGSGAHGRGNPGL